MCDGLVVDLKIDMGEVSQNFEELYDGFEESMLRFVNQVGQLFDTVSSNVKSLVSELLSSIGSLSEHLSSITGALNSICKQYEEESKQELGTSIVSSLLNAVQIGVDVYSTEVTRTKGKFESGQKSMFGGLTGAYTTDNDASENGITNGIFAGMGDMSSMLPDAQTLESLSTMITKLKESATAWVAQTGAKLADKAVDLQIIALYAADNVKAFGAMIARIAASTAAWVKNTAAKVASTAAEWAQIAATTAWNALCAVATTVTTAFGAAMAFLTSPIGLVVVAITALIAIIVLLVKNWDTVKAAAVSVWEGIKATFSAVGAWFYQNVVAPVAGFFSGMWDGFRQAAVNAWEGVKAVFSTVAGFFGKVFSEAWAGVVKVFSAAGNIFVNIKDAIVSVFKSVVNGLIRGINSIVAIPFNGINGALTMVKNIRIFGLQPFSGLKTISVPQIPYLAQGAVLPANKPFLGVVAASKLTQYRLQQLEDKVSKHNSLVERTYILEGQMTECIHDIRDLKAFHRPTS